MKCLIYIPVMIVALGLCFACGRSFSGKKQPLAVNGVLDLRDWNFEKDGPVLLNGQWEFYWKQLLEQADFGGQTRLRKTGLIKVPSYWNGYQVQGAELSGYGYATYRLRVMLNPKQVPLALHCLEVGNSYRLYSNGVLVSFNGKVARDRAHGVPQWLPKTASLYNPGEPLEILLQVSNFHHRVGGVWSSINLGTSTQIFQQRDENIALALFLLGSLSLMGLYHLGIFLLMKKDRAPLYFGLFCLVVSIHSMLAGEMFLINFFPNLPWELSLKIDYGTFYIGLPIFASFLDRVFPRIFNKRILQLLWGVTFLYTLAVLVFPVRWFSHSLQSFHVVTVLSIVYMSYTVLLAFVRKMEGAGLFLLGIIVLSVGVINDILYLNQLTRFRDMSSIGLFVFIFIQAYLLSTRSSRAFASVEDLSNDMEGKVKERTREAEAGRQLLEGLSEVSRRVSGAGDLPAVLTAVHVALMEHLGPVNAWLLLVDEQQGELYTNAYRPIPGALYTEAQDRFLKEFRVSLKWEAGSLFRTYTKKRILLLNTLWKGKGQFLDLQIAETLGFSSFAQLPLIVHNEVIGILAIGSQVPIRRRKIPWLKLFADQTAGAVNSANLLARTEQARAEIHELNEFSKKLNATADLNEHLDHICSYVQNHYKVDGVIILRTDLELNALVHLYAMVPPHLQGIARAFQAPLNEEGGLSFRTYRRNKPFYVSSAMMDRDIFRKPYSGMELDRKLFEGMGLSSFLQVPLNVQERVIGLVMFTSWKEESQLSRPDIPAIARFCEQIAGDLYASSLLERIRDKHQAADLARAQAEVAASEVEELNRLALTINESVDIDAILDDVFAYFKKAFRIDGSVLFLREPGAEELYVLKFLGPFQHFAATERVSLTPALGSLYSTFIRRKPLYIRGAQKRLGLKSLGELDRQILESWEINDLLQIPLVIQNQSIGILCLTRLHEPMHLTKEEIGSIERTCEQIAGGIYSTSLFKQDGQRSRELGRANQKLQSLDRAKTRFFANISHEFRTPLTLILAPVESLLKGDYGETISKSNAVFKSILQNGVRLLRLINNLLDFTSIEAGRMSAVKQQTDMVELLEYYKSSILPAAETQGLRVVFNHRVDKLLAYIDRDLMEKAVMNVLSNAIKFTPAGGEIIIQLEEQKDEWFTLSVKDSGIGVRSDQLETIFERFRQADNSKFRKFEGTGIGLSLTKEIVELHGGQVTVQSQPGVGAVFTLQLPVGSPFVEQLEHRLIELPKSSPMADLAEEERKKEKAREFTLLMVEDNADMRTFLKTLLEPVYVVHTAPDGKAGLAKARELVPDLVLSDVMMPEMDGYEMTQSLKRNRETRDIPVILLSAKADVTHRIEGLQFGADDYLSKPFNSEELLARIRNQIESRKLEKALKKENTEIEKELRHASQIQKNILTDRTQINQIEELEIELAYIPMNGQVSGDYYNISPMENGIASIFVADAMGHGTQAALATMQIDILYRDNLERKYPEERFRRISDKFLSELQSKNYFTGVNVDIMADKIRYSNAGHPEQYLIRAEKKEIQRLDTRDGMIGVGVNQSYKMEEVEIEKGDMLLLFTDGIFEVFSSDRKKPGQELFFAFLQEEIRNGLFLLPMKGIIESIMESVTDFKKNEGLRDDITLIGVRLQ